ncbi:Pex19 protein [Wilcoxina mikolae CBS 423.85]|nr:Pex19 protein [Wilcoxina mikolae CBS 423.85]
MADLLNDVNESPEMQGQFEKLAKELNDAMASTASKTTTPGPSSAPAAAADPTAAKFQDRIKQTMERMKSSNAEVDAGLAEPDSDDFLAEMLKSMGGTGEAGEEDFSNMLVNMMEQLTSKEILYEPMKELYEKYPEWIRKNEAKESKENMVRYREQFSIVKDIVLKFDEPNYKDENDADREYIVERMQKMQSAGAPPQELMGDMGQGLEPPDLGSDCAVQ